VSGPPARLIPLLASLLMVGSLLAADIASKSWAEYDLRRRGSRTLLGGNLILRYQTNSGIAFGVFTGSLHPQKQSLLIAYSSVMGAALAAGLAFTWLRRQLRARRLMAAALIALLAGTAGNLRDRITRGAVIDFIDVDFPGGRRWPAFNLADLYLAVGLLLVVSWLVIARRERSDQASR
jgi:signal peptidase II